MLRVRQPAVAIALSAAALGGATLAHADAPLGLSRCAKATEREESTRPRLLHSPAPAALRSLLGVLERPATAADALPHSAIPRVGFTKLWVASARLLATEGGTRYFVLPVVAAAAVPRACKVGVPASELRPLERAARAQARGALSIVPVGAPEGVGAPGPATRAEILAGDPFIAPQGTSHSGPAYGLVPNGVASLTIGGPVGPPVSATVTDDFFYTTVRFAAKAGEQRFTTRWLAASGAVIKTFATPAPVS
ncbi:MAG TPA: hypothetical protein VHX88_12210 [Solirubrobacteraceae bacterium]|jgi:hypothetical protein|nr:hypothetical protein [Solirubrobacteraceae bacterium]